MVRLTKDRSDTVRAFFSGRGSVQAVKSVQELKPEKGAGFRVVKVFPVISARRSVGFPIEMDSEIKARDNLTSLYGLWW